jgi:predicted nucleic acid-binding protein
MKPKVYLETSVISYLASRPSRDLIVAANQQSTQEWWEKRLARVDVYISQVVVQEVSSGDADAVAKRLEVIAGFPLLEIAPEAVQLAEQFMTEKAIPNQAVEDALHIAVAAVNGINYLLTWNLKHIANAVIRANVEAICRLSGYEPPVICTPAELMEI